MVNANQSASEAPYEGVESPKCDDGSEKGMTREAAKEMACKMGLEGIHRMGTGGFMPGSSHESYMAAVDRAKEDGKS